MSIIAVILALALGFVIGVLAGILIAWASLAAYANTPKTFSWDNVQYRIIKAD